MRTDISLPERGITAVNRGISAIMARILASSAICAFRSSFPGKYCMRALAPPLTLLGSSSSLAQSKLDASIFSYDGKDFTRTETTLMQGGRLAVGIKLDPN